MNILHRETKRSMKQSERIKQSKLIASAQNKWSKSFWRAVKALCGDSKKPNETEQSVKVSYKQLREKTDIEKCKIFKILLQDTMKDHIYENLELNEPFEKVENETKLFLQYKNTELNNYCIIKVCDYEEVLNKTRRSNPGPDKISYNILKGLPKFLNAYICLLITSSIINSYVPTTWKESQVKMLPKTNKNKKDAENYRLISLTKCIAKTCETAVKNFVLAHCEEKDVFGEMQSAYRRNRCTTDNLLKLTQHVTEAFQWSEMIGFVCLDIEKAFDAVWRLGLQNKLL